MRFSPCWGRGGVIRLSGWLWEDRAEWLGARPWRRTGKDGVTNGVIIILPEDVAARGRSLFLKRVSLVTYRRKNFRRCRDSQEAIEIPVITITAIRYTKVAQVTVQASVIQIRHKTRALITTPALLLTHVLPPNRGTPGTTRTRIVVTYLPQLSGTRGSTTITIFTIREETRRQPPLPAYSPTTRWVHVIISPITYKTFCETSANSSVACETVKDGPTGIIVSDTVPVIEQAGIFWYHVWLMENNDRGGKVNHSVYTTLQDLMCKLMTEKWHAARRSQILVYFSVAAPVSDLWIWKRHNLNGFLQRC